MNSLQRSQPLLLEQEHQVERGWWLLGGGKTRSVHPAHFRTIHAFCGPLWCRALWAGASAIVLLSTYSCFSVWPPFRLCYSNPQETGSCSCLLPPASQLQTQGSSLPSVVRDLTISSVPKHLPTGCPGSGCSSEKLLVYTVLCYQLIPCTELQCTSLGMRPVWKTGSSARKMGKRLQLDFSYRGKRHNSICFSLFSLIPF